MSYVTIDIDIDEIISGLSRRELENLAESLYHDGYWPKEVEKAEQRNIGSIGEQTYREAITKLANNYYQLTAEEEATIINISKKF